MPRRPFDDPLPRLTVEEMVEDLRDEAEDLARALEDIPAHETLGAQAAQTLEEFADALTRIAEGSDDPQGIAAAALNCEAPLRRIGAPEDVVRMLGRVPATKRPGR